MAPDRVGLLEGKAAMLTGTSSGIGRAIAVRFAVEGAKVVLASRTTAGDEETARLVRDAGGTAVVVPTDITDPDQVQRAVDETLSHFGQIDCAVNNAARVGVPASTATQTLEEWEATVRTNLTGTWLCMRAQLNAMLAAGNGGSIVNTASAGGLVGAPTMPAYSATKAGVLGITRTAALEFATSGIRVNAICPGPVETPMTLAMAQAGGPSAADVAQLIPMGRPGAVQDIASVAAFLSSDDACFITGVALPVDGGMVAG
jgi:NAD(P)-dependent dehydrogenase (short-subunit alcohol dehydrogenase family)